MFQKYLENDSKVFVSLSVLKLFVRIEVNAASQALGGLVFLVAVCFSYTIVRGLPKPPKPGTYQEPGSVKISKTRNRNLPGSPKT